MIAHIYYHDDEITIKHGDDEITIKTWPTAKEA